MIFQWQSTKSSLYPPSSHAAGTVSRWQWDQNHCQEIRGSEWQAVVRTAKAALDIKSQVLQMSRLLMLAGLSLPSRADIRGGILLLHVISPPDFAASSQVLSQVGEVQVMSLFKKYLFLPFAKTQQENSTLSPMFSWSVPGLRCAGPFSGCNAAPAWLLGSVSYFVSG